MDISGIPPERLPVAPDLKKLQRQVARGQITSAPLPLELSVNPSVDENPLPTPALGRPVDLRRDLWKYALLAMARRPDGEISTSDLLKEMPDYIQVPDAAQDVLPGRNDNKFSQLVRNLKSHKTTKTNFIFQGYAEDVKGGFRITPKGREFVKSYFAG